MPSNSKEILKVASDLLKKYGDDVVVRDGRKVDFIKTGSISLDAAIGIGGFPRGRICDLYGRESAGKSMVATCVVAEVQKFGGFPVYIDAENAFDERWAKVLGVDCTPEKLLRLSPSTGEQAFDIAEDVIKKGADLVVIDSTAALIPQECVERPMEDGALIGRQAALIARGVQKLTSIVAKTRSIVLFIDQVRKNIGGNPYLHQEDESPTGGLALGFYSSVRIRVRRKEAIKDGDKLLGHVIECFLKKNKVSPPLKKVEFSLYYDRGIDSTSEIFDVAVAKNILVHPEGGHSYTFGDFKWNGQAKVQEAIKTDPDLAAKLLEAISKPE